MFDQITNNLLFSQGLSIVAVLALCGIAAFFVYRPLLIIVAGFFLFSLYFFRNPERHCLAAETDAAIIICPADGRVVDVQYDPESGIEGFAYKISIFLSPFDVHVNWTPVAGMVDRVVYRPGTFSLAFLPKSSELNERNDIHLHAADGNTLVVRQISGAVARRICCWVKEGELVPAGYKYGMIRFGSRVDILLPKNVQVNVGVGNRVYGGQTVVGRWI
jgi:phosphatidylserine decarboxylase